MQTVGEILKNTRVEKNLTLEAIEQKTRIRKKYLVALEGNAFDRLPGTAYTIGFLKNYSRVLGLEPQVILALFRRGYDEKTSIPVLPTGITDPVDKPWFAITPRWFATAAGTVLFCLFLGYILFQYRFAVGDPTLIIESPQNNLVTSDDKVTIRGKTDPDAQVTINGGEISAQVDGSFSQDVSVLLGSNTYLITVTSKFGKKTDTSLMIERRSR